MFYTKEKSLFGKLDKGPLWIPGGILVLLTFLPHAVMGQGSVFAIHDQLDETICSYLFTAKHIFSGEAVYPEMMGGVSANGMLPSAVLFVLLYCLFPVYEAFVLQSILVALSACFGMYGLMKKMTGSSGVAMVVGVLFSLLPCKPVYGLSVAGVPLLLFCLWLLYEKRHVTWGLAGVVYFGLTTHLVLIGYVVLTYLGIAALWILLKKKGHFQENLWFYVGLGMLILVYGIVNFDMFLQLFLGQGGFVSHREEFVNNTVGIQVWRSIKNMFLYGDIEYAPSLHWYLTPVLLGITVFQGIRFTKLSETGKGLWKTVMALWGILLISHLVYGFLTSETVMTWKNAQAGFFRYFQMERYYWAFPTIWWMLAGAALALIWLELPKCPELLRAGILLVLLLPTLSVIKNYSTLYDNINQYNHGSAYTGIPTWREHFMEDVLEQVDAYIGKDKSSYRVAHVGLNPAPSLVYGFFTVDGYSNNYSLEYKHAFRRVIAKELEKSDSLKSYFDIWGSRCYLFSAEGNQPLKSAEFVYQNLDYDTAQLKELGCEYIFSAGEIKGNLKNIMLEGVFETDNSIYEIWLYRID